MGTVCKYCDGDRDAYVSFLPKLKKGCNAFVSTVGHMGRPHLVVTTRNDRGEFVINYCPICGKKLVKGENHYE